MLLFNFAVASATTLIFSLAPTLHTYRLDINTSLKEAGALPGAGKARTRMLLVVIEMALAVVLLAGAGLMTRGFWGILNLYHGIDPGSILALATPLPEAKYTESTRVADFYSRTLQRIQAISEVTSACITSNTPLNNRPNPSMQFIIEGRPPLPGERQAADLTAISPAYPRMVGAWLRRGRYFTERDGGGTTPVALINEAAARVWPKGDVLGARIKREGSAPGQPWVTVVGIVGDVKQSWFDREIRPQVYLPYLQAPRTSMFFLIETQADPMGLAAAARPHILAVDANQPIDNVRTLARLFADEISPMRFAAVLMLAFGAIALVLSAVGIYGVMSFVVARRTNEIGIRAALGGRRGDVLRLILGQGMKPVALGLLLGIPAALALGRFMASVLFGVVALDYSILMGLLLLLTAVAFLSIFVPANRASRMDPMAALPTNDRQRFRIATRQTLMRTHRCTAGLERVAIGRVRWSESGGRCRLRRWGHQPVP